MSKRATTPYTEPLAIQVGSQTLLVSLPQELEYGAKDEALAARVSAFAGMVQDERYTL
jgi:hypothetical protein